MSEHPETGQRRRRGRCRAYNSLFIGDEAPQVDLEVVDIHLDLLQAVLTERLQSHAFQQGLRKRHKIGLLAMVTETVLRQALVV